MPITRDSTEEQTIILFTNCWKKNLSSEINTREATINKSARIHTDPFIENIKRYVNLSELKVQLRTECTG